MMIREEMFRRLTNWRRVYGDNAAPAVSITEIACRYARATIKRKSETPEEQSAREEEELMYRDPPNPAPNYRDANILQSVWSSMAPTIAGVSVKSIIKTITFGDGRAVKRLRCDYGRKAFYPAVEKAINIFFLLVEDYERSISRPPSNDETFTSPKT